MGSKLWHALYFVAATMLEGECSFYKPDRAANCILFAKNQPSALFFVFTE